MLEDRLKFRQPCYIGDEFIGFGYCTVGEHFEYTQTGTDSNIDGQTGYFAPIEQCTGLKDKHGNLIYVGDIVKSGLYKGVIKFGHYGYPIDKKNYGFYVEMDNEDFRSDLGFWVNDETAGVEVIGNIHQKD